MQIIYANESFFKGFHQTLDYVAREQIYIEMIEAKPFEELAEFQRKLIAHHWPTYYAVEDGEVLGWADIIPSENPRLAHRGFLGMGLLPKARGKGIGTQLLTQALKHAKECGLEKVELTVYVDNPAAIHLYQKCGFAEVGRIRHYRKLNDRYFDCILMELFLSASKN